MVKSAPATPPINLCVGGYDGSVAGISLNTDEDDLLSLSADFAYAPHTAAVRSAALHGSTLVTGSADDTIRIYDLNRRIEQGTLFMHNGTINSLSFVTEPTRTVLFSASDDASIAVWRTSDWHCLKRLTAHQAPVLDVTVHSSARLALSVASDRSLFMWNLVRGRVAFSAKTKCVTSCVQWSPVAQEYLLAAEKVVSLSDVEGRTVETIEYDTLVNSVQYMEDGRVLSGGEDGVVRIWDRRESANVATSQHKMRVKGVQAVKNIILSGDSGGGVKIWDVRAGRVRLETNIGGGDLRLTCLAAATVVPDAPPVVEEDAENVKGKKRMRHGKKDTKSDVPEVKLEGTASQRKRKKRNKA